MIKTRTDRYQCRDNNNIATAHIFLASFLRTTRVCYTYYRFNVARDNDRATQRRGKRRFRWKLALKLEISPNAFGGKKNYNEATVKQFSRALSLKARRLIDGKRGPSTISFSRFYCDAIDSVRIRTTFRPTIFSKILIFDPAVYRFIGNTRLSFKSLGLSAHAGPGRRTKDVRLRRKKRSRVSFFLFTLSLVRSRIEDLTTIT